MSHDYPSVKGQISANGQTVSLPTSDGSSSGFNIRGTFVGTLQFEVSMDGENWIATSVTTSLTSAGAIVSSATSPGLWFGSTAGATQVRVRASAWTSGAADVLIKLSDDPMLIFSVPLGAAGAPAAAGTALIGDVGIQYRANATGAASMHSVLSPLTPAGTVVKASAGRVVGVMLTNSAASLRSVKLFNATAATMGTTSAAFEIDIPANGTFMFNLEGGMAFTTGIVWAVTSAKGLTDNTATGLAVNDVSGVIFYL